MDIKSDFNGFGPLPSSKPTFAQGTGINSSFAPIWTKDPEQQKKESYNKKVTPADTSSFPWKLVPTTEDVGGTQEPRVLVTYGEVDGTAPSGMTLGTDYILDVGSSANTIIYLILTFDGTGLMTSVTIGYNTTLPTNTDDTKYIPIGVVSLVDGVYEINEQVLTQYVYTEQALYINNSTGGLVYSLFADPRKIHIVNDLENFVVDLDGVNNISKIYLENNSNSEYIELKKDTQNSISAVDGFSGSGEQNFSIVAGANNHESYYAVFDSSGVTNVSGGINSTNQIAVIDGWSNNHSQNFQLTADSNLSYSNIKINDNNGVNQIESKTDSSKNISSIVGVSNSSSENFMLKADSQNNQSTMSLYDTSSANYLSCVVDSTSITSINGYTNNQEQQFLIKSDSTEGTTKSVLFDSGSTQYLESKVDTDNTKTSVYGYSGNGSQNFKIESDSNNQTTKSSLYDSSSAYYIESKIDSQNASASVYGYGNSGDENFKLIADSQNQLSSLTLYDGGSATYLESKIDTTNLLSSVYGYSGNNIYNFKLAADGNANKSTLSVYGQGSNVYAELVTEDGKASVWGYSDNEAEEFVLKAKDGETMLYLKGGGKEVTIDIPDNNGTLLDAKWQEIDVCVDGQLKKMKVLGTDPYDPPA